MPITHIPQDGERWIVSFFDEFLGDIVRSFNLSLTSKQGKVAVSPRLQPHTTQTGVDRAPTQYVLTNADGTLRYWKYWGPGATVLWKTPGTSILDAFANDTLINTPTFSDGVDGDLAVFGRTSNGAYDILYESGGINIARFDRDVSTTTWVKDYWTGLQATIVSSANNGGGLVRMTTSAPHGYTTGDKVIIRDHSEGTYNGPWTITVISPTTFDLQLSTFIGAGSGGTVNRTFATSTGITYLGQPALESGYPIVLQRFTSNLQDLLLIGNKNFLHSIDLQGNAIYKRLVFFPDYEVSWIKCTKERAYIGFRSSNGVQFQSYVTEYDPLTETTRSVIVPEGSTTGFIWHDICHIVDVKGNVSRFNADGFTPVSRFPFAYIDGIFMIPIHRNGIAFIDDNPHFLCSAQQFNFSTIFPAGLWCLEEETMKLYHRMSIAQSNTAGATGQRNFGDSSINGEPYGGLFWIPTTQNVTQVFVGAATEANYGGSDIAGTFTTFPVSGKTYFNNRGYFVTSKIDAKYTSTLFRNITTHFTTQFYPHGVQAGAISVKYRQHDPLNDTASISAVGTWMSETEFTVLTASIPDLVVGDEVFVLFGAGSGLSAHVTTIQNNFPVPGSSRITLDEDNNLNLSGNFAFVYENWRRLHDETFPDGLIDDPAQDHWQFDIPEDVDAPWVQFKIEIRSAGTTVFRGFLVEALQIGQESNIRPENLAEHDTH